MLFHRVNGNRWYNVKGYMEKIIQNHQVVIFSKTYCHFSTKMKQLIKKYNIRDQRVMELNLQPDMQLMQDYLKRRTGGIRTVPQLYVNGQFIGGFDTVERKERNGSQSRCPAKKNKITEFPDVAAMVNIIFFPRPAAQTLTINFEPLHLLSMAYLQLFHFVTVQQQK
ncbi:putative monothiol glutaredoxin F10D7.3 [Dirofilaria immitis]